ncbi:MAG: adenine deaminase [Firmicutes bacterium]|nr:adenine deaminase [Bacillota bacterium]
MVQGKIYPGTIVISDGKIVKIIKEKCRYTNFILPGLVDSHVHIESSMLIPSEFAKLAVVHGTVATVSDPHEIANVLGIPGIKFMIANGKKTNFKFNFGASSCVPATGFETAGANLKPQDIEALLKMKEIRYMSEMMNYPGVLFKDPDVMAKIEIAKKLGKPIDGHAPGLMGKDLETYVNAGISTDHETYMLDEGEQKIKLGMKVIIREGSAAKNFDTLHTLIGKYPDKIMFCSDDKHPDDLVRGHINEIVKKAFKLGYKKMDVIRCATLNPVKHYGLDVGLLQKGDPADLIVVDNLDNFRVLKTYINGKLVAESGKSLLPHIVEKPVNNFNTKEKRVSDFAVLKKGEKIHVIEALDGQLITKCLTEKAKTNGEYVIADTSNDNLKLTVVNRYKDASPAVAFIRNFGLKRGAIASSVAHDSHNVLGVGTNDAELTKAVNAVIKSKGGLVVVDGGKVYSLSLPVAGLMTCEDGYQVAKKYSELTKVAKNMGSNLHAPYMTLSFMALLVIPEAKLSDKGLFDGVKFKFMDLFN